MSALAAFVAIALALILVGAVYLARQLRAKRLAALTAWAEAGGWTFAPAKQAVAAGVLAAVGEPRGGFGEYNAHQVFRGLVPVAAGSESPAKAGGARVDVRMHLFEYRPTRVRGGRDAVDSAACLVAELPAGVELASSPGPRERSEPGLDPSEPVVRLAVQGTALVARRPGRATAEAYTALVAAVHQAIAPDARGAGARSPAEAGAPQGP